MVTPPGLFLALQPAIVGELASRTFLHARFSLHAKVTDRVLVGGVDDVRKGLASKNLAARFEDHLQQQEE